MAISSVMISCTSMMSSAEIVSEVPLLVKLKKIIVP